VLKQTMTIANRSATLAGILLLSSSATLFAQDEATAGDAQESAVKDGQPDRQRRGLSDLRSRTGEPVQTPPFGGRNSPSGEIVETQTVEEPAFRFPRIDEAVQPWHEWKEDISKTHGIQLSAHYSTMFVSLSDPIPGGEDKASSGVFRGTMKWNLVGRDTPDVGSLNIMLDHRHGFRDTVPASMAGQAGYIGVSHLFYNDIGFAVINLNWQQSFNDGDTGLIVGRYDPNDYQGALGYVNPWTIFSNIASSLDPSVAFPDSSWGVGAGHWFNDNVYVLGGINDANGFSGDDLEFFDGGAEFYKFFHVGWSPSKGERYFKNVHAMTWHVDEREEAGIPSSSGLAIGANWTFNDRWMPFLRIGFSNGDAPIYNESFTVGMIYKPGYRSDLVGISINKGSPPAQVLRDQTTVEAFWRFQFSQAFAITPSVQYLKDPALHPTESSVWMLGLRTRFAF
jgi:porin